MSGDDSMLADEALALPPIELAILSRVGGRERNEDACGHWHSDAWLCCVLADGAGGHGGGDVASRLAVRQLIQSFSEQPTLDPQSLDAMLRAANRDVISHRADSAAVRNMYTTAVLLAIDLERGQAAWGHAGDSRLYVLRGGAVHSHTRDHSYVQTLVDAGMLSADHVRDHPRGSELLSALGVEPEDFTVSTSSEAWSLQAGDVFLLCTDGLWEYIDETEMSASLARAASAEDWLAQLEQGVLRHAAEAGKKRHDNYSAVAVWIGSPDR